MRYAESTKQGSPDRAESPAKTGDPNNLIRLIPAEGV